MRSFDWLVLLAFFGYTLWDGIRHRKQTEGISDLLLAGRSMPWWAAGLSVMATQASAITFIGTTGQAYMHDMRFLQVYLGLPIAMIILSVTLVPFFHRHKPFTAYEALEKRFGLRVRLTTSFMFLLSRAVGLGITIAAPAYVLALLLDVPLVWTNLIIGLAATVYTMFGGIAGVIRTDMKQMILMLLGMVICFYFIRAGLPDVLSTPEALELAGASGKLKTIDLKFDLGEKYNLWSGLIAGLFLMLSYFGTDQSQVQRYLTAKSLGDAKMSLMLSAILKVPMQFFILLLGVYLYVFYIFEPHPLLFSPQPKIESCRDQVPPMEAEFQFWQESRKAAALAFADKSLHADEAKARYLTADEALHKLRKQELIRQESLSGKSRNDTNYVFPFFMLTQLPVGILGLIVAAILAAALSSIDSMLNSLAATTVVDWYQRLRPKPQEDAFYLRLTRWSTAGWGVLATLSAIAFGETESIIELTNQLGSYFYGPMLGVFVLIWIKWASPRGALWGLGLGLIGVMVAGSWFHGCTAGSYSFLFPLGRIPEGYEPVLEYLWLNPLGTILTVGVAWLWRKRKRLETDTP